MHRVLAGLAAATLAATAAMAEQTRDNPLVDGETWEDLRYDVVGDALLHDGGNVIALEAPFRAHDAAIVPIRIVQPDGSDQKIDRLVIVIDENPAPVVAEFTLGDAMGRLDMETRVRVNQYSNVRAIAETSDGQLHMTGRFVRASGGCSAPAAKDASAAMAALGKMKLRQLELAASQPHTDAAAQSTSRRVAQVMIRHPNYSGLQRDQITQLFIGAHFVNEIEVFQGDKLLFRMEGGISISEDPSIRFSYTDNGDETIRVRATDTEGAVFEQVFEKSAIAI